MTPSISVFIVNFNTCSLLEQCLQSLFDTKGDLSIEVFVADNNSTDGSPEMVRARFPEVSLITYSQNVGYTRAINSVLRLGEGKYYLLLHPDLEILPNTLEPFVKFFESHPQAGILGGNLYYPDGSPNPSEVLFPNFNNEVLCFALRFFRKLPGGKSLVGNHNPMEWSRRSTSQVNWVWNACMMVRREVFEGISYFDEDFFVWYADWDLCKRAADAGWSVYYLHPAKAIHHERHSFARDDNISDEVRYKVDGWYSAPSQIKDRHVFLRKHGSLASIYGIKTVYIVENALRLWLILGNFVFRKTTVEEASFQLRACVQTIQTIMKN
jgi:GT2 family glycosyltransferase